MSRFPVVCSVRNRSTLVVLALILAAGAAYGVLRMSQASPPQEAAAPNPAPPAATPPVPPPPAEVRPTSIYSEVRSDRLNPATVGALTRVYVPNLRSRTVSVIDPETFKVIDHFNVGPNPQHVVPAWDMKTLWVTGSAEGRGAGSLTAIDPLTGKPEKSIPVPDAYNLYFTPDGKSAMVVVEESKALDYRDAQTMELQGTLKTPECAGINHADFSQDGSYAIFTCEFAGGLVKIDPIKREVLGNLKLSKGRMPQDIRISPDGKVFYVADMMADGIFVIDGDSFKEVGFIATGVGAHGLTPSRDGTKLYVANRGSHSVHGARKGPGSVSVLNFATQQIEQTWKIPGGGSPDMGNLSIDGKYLWLSGRFDDVVYAIDTSTGEVRTINVEAEPHGLTVWPQPGRYSLGHTGNMR